MGTRTIPTIPIDEEMLRMGERDMQEGYEKFVQAGIAEWHKERAEQNDRKAEQSQSYDCDSFALTGQK